VNEWTVAMSNVKGLFSVNEWTVAMSLPPWTRFFICISSFPFSSSLLLFCSPCQALPWCSVILGYRGVGECVWVCERANQPLTFRKHVSHRRKKQWSGVFAKSWCVGERLKGYVRMMCEISETKKN